MNPEHVILEVVNHEEYVELDGEMNPIEGLGTAYLHLKSPNGSILRAEITHDDLDPLLALMYPDFGLQTPGG